MPLLLQPGRREALPAREAARRLFALPAEVLVDGARLVLGALALLTIWIDPIRPVENTPVVQGVLLAYVALAALLLAIPADRKRAGRVQLALHGVDIILFSALMH